jgi:ATP-dependent Clp protease ATP-binding subunit ClpA
VVGREREVGRVVQILARRTKNNPILLGEPGVGKTAIAEGLAAAIVHRHNSLDGGPLPQFLHSKRILQLDVGLLIAGAWGAKGRTMSMGPPALTDSLALVRYL